MKRLVVGVLFSFFSFVFYFTLNQIGACVVDL